jgi:uncharacterized protein (TIGR00159 family)
MGQFIELITTIHLSDFIDVALLAVVIYWVLLLIQGTRTIPMLIGLTVLLGTTYVLATLFNLDAMGWLVENVVSSAVVILVVLFQADIRNALAQVGLTTMRPQLSLAEQAGLIEELTLAAFTMAHRRIGALIVLERETGLRNYIERGKAIQAVPTLELLLSIFHTGSPLHDGAAIIDREGRLAAARCILPLSPSSAARPYMGTRHRAALGLSEETDALVIVVSEERGEVSLVFRGRLTENLERTALTNLITQTLRMTREHDAIPETPAEAQSA